MPRPHVLITSMPVPPTPPASLKSRSLTADTMSPRDARHARREAVRAGPSTPTAAARAAGANAGGVGRAPADDSASDGSHAEDGIVDVVEDIDGTEAEGNSLPEPFESSVAPLEHDVSASDVDGDSDSDEDGEDSGSDSDSDDSDSASDASTETSANDDDDDDDDEAFERLLAAAKERAAAATVGHGPLSASTLQDELEVAFGRDNVKEAPIPDLAVPALPAQHLAFNPDGSARAAASVPQVVRSDVPELDAQPYERELSKREKARQPKKASVSETWATIPAPRADRVAEMRRDYQALALANTLDPKRFMKGGSRAGKVPERFAIGTVVDAPRQLQATTLAREKKYRAGQIVESIARDEAVGAYAKRKYEDLQGTRMRNGRGQGWRKRSKW
ncbi:dTDP-fucopyranose mutase [Cryptotrichosporon argae]